MKTVAVLVFYLIIAVGFTWPLPLFISTALDNDGDALAVLCPLAYLGDNLWTQPWNLFHAPFYYPHPEILRTGYFLFWVSFFFAPLRWVTGSPVAAMNIVHIITLAMNGFAMYFLVRHLTLDSMAGFIAGCIFAFCPFRVAHFQQPSLMTSYWAVWSLLLLHIYFNDSPHGNAGHIRTLVTALLFYLLQCLSDVTTAVYFGMVIFPFIAFSLPLGWKRFGMKIVLPVIGCVAVLVSCLAAVLLPLHFHRSDLVIESRVADIEMVQELSSPLSGYMATPPGNFLYGRATRNFWVHPCQINFYGMLAACLAACGVFPIRRNGWRTNRLVSATQFSRNRMARFLFFPCIVAFLISLGPWIFLAPGKPLCVGPYMPIYLCARPFRTLASLGAFGMVSLLAVSVWAGLGVKKLLDYAAAHMLARRSALFLGILLLLTIEYAGYPPTSASGPFFQIQGVPPAIYRWLIEQEDRDPIIELPMEWEPEEVEGAFGLDNAAMYWSIFHRRNIINGFSDYWYPDYKIIADQMKLFPSRETIDILHSLGVRYVIMHIGRLPRLEWQRELMRQHPEAAYDWKKTLSGLDQFGDELVLRSKAGADRVYEILPRRNISPSAHVPQEGLLPHDEWTATANVNPLDAPLAIDGREDTTWSTKGNQIAGIFFQVDLGSERDVDGIGMLLRSVSACPKNPKIEVSTDGEKWHTVSYEGAYLDLIQRLLSNPKEKLFNITFSPVRARYIRITLTRFDNLYPWSIAELNVYGQD